MGLEWLFQEMGKFPSFVWRERALQKQDCLIALFHQQVYPMGSVLGDYFRQRTILLAFKFITHEVEWSGRRNVAFFQFRGRV